MPSSVSIVEKQCDTATSNLKQVIYNKLPDGEKKKKFAVCVKVIVFDVIMILISILTRAWTSLMMTCL